MARHWFGGTSNDMVVRKWNFGSGNNLLALASGQQVTLWDAATGGSRHIDLLVDGLPVQLITADEDGYAPRFQCPDGVQTCWADLGDGSPRRLMVTTDVAIDLSSQLATRIPTTEKGAADGVATLDAGGKVPDAQLPDGIARDSEVAATYAAKSQFKVTDGGEAAGAGTGGPTRPNVQIGGDINGTTIDADQIHCVILQPGGPGFNNIIGGDGSATVRTATPNAVSPDAPNCGVSLIGGYDNVVGQISSKIISDHSYTEMPPVGSTASGHNAIYGGQGHIIRWGAKHAGIFGGDRCDIGGDYAFATGLLNVVNGDSASATGQNNTVTSDALGSTVDGASNTVSGAYSAVTGQNNTASASYSTVHGTRGVANKPYQHVVSAGRFAVDGDAQSMVVPQHVQSTSESAVIFGVGGAGMNPLVPAGGAVTYSVMIIATDVSTRDVAAWRVEGTMKRGLTGFVAHVGTPTITKRDADAGTSAWTVGLSTSSNNALSFYGIGESGKTINWVARVTITQVIA